MQNEFILCIENNVREQIVTRWNSAQFLSIMADDTTDCGTVEQLSLCVRYVFEVN